MPEILKHRLQGLALGIGVTLFYLFIHTTLVRLADLEHVLNSLLNALRA